MRYEKGNFQHVATCWECASRASKETSFSLPMRVSFVEEKF
jgi:hypothetical protein